MKIITRIFVTVLTLAVVAFFAIVIFEPEKGKELQEKIIDMYTGRGEAVEVSPVKELSIDYELPFEDEEAMYGKYDFQYGFDPSYPDRVYTWFKDLGRDLWLPFLNDSTRNYWVGDAVLLDRNGIVKRLDSGEYTGNSATGEAVLYADALAGVPEGDYWVGLLVSSGRPEESYYLFRYIAVYEECTFHTEDYEIVTGNWGDILVDRSSGEGFTFHLANLGDNKVLDVWKLENMLGQFTRKHLTQGEDYTLSEDGASVSLTAEYLDSLQDLYGYWFLFGLSDHSEVSPVNEEDGSQVRIYLTDGPILDPPYLEGPETYSVSSGKDYVFTVHLGRAVKIMEQNSGLYFFNEEGPSQVDEKGNQMKALDILNDGIKEDETYVIPAQVFEEAAKRGDTWAQVGVLFQVTDFAASGYYPYWGLTVNLVP